MSITVTKSTRSDKKTMVRPTLTNELVNTLTELASFQGYTTKRNGETEGAPSPYATELVRAAMRDELVLLTLAPYFKTSYIPSWDLGRLFRGLRENPKLQAMLPDGNDTTRFPVKFTSGDYAELSDIAKSLQASAAEACAILLVVARMQGVTVPDKDERSEA